MSIAKPRELMRSDKPAGIEGNIRKLGQQSSVVCQPEDNGKKASASVSLVSLASTLRLIDDLKGLRERLKIEGDRIQHDIVEFVSLSQSAIQLTKIVSDSTRKRC